MHEALRDYLNIRTANSLNITKEQVEKTNILEANAVEGKPFNVELVGDTIKIRGTYHDGYWPREYVAWVKPDGTVSYGRP